MKPRPSIAAAALVLGIGLALLAFLPSANATQPGFHGVGTTNPAFLQIHAVPPMHLAPTMNSRRVLLPKSTRTSFGTVCSVLSTDTGNPPECSSNSSSRPCTAYHRRGMECSAFAVAGGGTAANCSTGQANKTKCSVLSQVGNGTPSTCSASSAVAMGNARCSVMKLGRNKFCTTDNRNPVAGSQCSAIALTMGFAQCSVLMGGMRPNNGPNSCSVDNGQPAGNPGQCSAFAANTSCSVNPASSGGCTVRNGAPAGSCSAHVAMATCSTIGGGGPNAMGQCRVP